MNNKTDQDESFNFRYFSPGCQLIHPLSDPALIKSLGWQPAVNLETLASWMILDNMPE